MTCESQVKQVIAAEQVAAGSPKARTPKDKLGSERQKLKKLCEKCATPGRGCPLGRG